jgi:hypothetical protein
MTGAAFCSVFLVEAFAAVVFLGGAAVRLRWWSSFCPLVFRPPIGAGEKILRHRA